MSLRPERWLLPDRVFDGDTMLAGVALQVLGPRTGMLAPVAAISPQATLRRLRGTIAPGYLDLQVNGGGDRLLNNDPSPEALRIMAAAHRRFGTVAILPTVITDAPEVLARAVEAVLATRRERGPLGLHIEGPHLAEARRGTHAAEWLRPLEADPRSGT